MALGEKPEYTEEMRCQRAARKRARTCWVTGATEEDKERAVRLALNQVSGAKKYSWLNQEPETPAQSLGTARALLLGIEKGEIAKELKIGKYRPDFNNEVEQPRLQLNVKELRGMGINLSVEDAEQIMKDCGHDDQAIEEFRALNGCNSSATKEEELMEKEDRELEAMFLACDTEQEPSDKGDKEPEEMTEKELMEKEDRELEAMFLACDTAQEHSDKGDREPEEMDPACNVEPGKNDSHNRPTNSGKDPTKKRKRDTLVGEHNDQSAEVTDADMNEVASAERHRRRRADKVTKKRKIAEAEENSWRAEHNSKKKRGLEIEQRRAAEAAKQKQYLKDKGSSKDCPIEL
ncbi:hypothetical protein F5Y18DRAFT_437536 [Xylariaceae sp. FL1019]|nr:hypothetical protein F5Y18DRAFT_437536 [Xylariaceae sp. FL1019]